MCLRRVLAAAKAIFRRPPTPPDYSNLFDDEAILEMLKDIWRAEYYGFTRIHPLSADDFPKIQRTLDIYADRSITCPKCGKTSYHLDDVWHRYCGQCGYHEDLG